MKARTKKAAIKETKDLGYRKILPSPKGNIWLCEGCIKEIIRQMEEENESTDSTEIS